MSRLVALLAAVLVLAAGVAAPSYASRRAEGSHRAPAAAASVQTWVSPPYNVTLEQVNGSKTNGWSIVGDHYGSLVTISLPPLATIRRVTCGGSTDPQFTACATAWGAYYTDLAAFRDATGGSTTP